MGRGGRTGALVCIRPGPSIFEAEVGPLALFMSFLPTGSMSYRLQVRIRYSTTM